MWKVISVEYEAVGKLQPSAAEAGGGRTEWSLPGFLWSYPNSSMAMAFIQDYYLSCFTDGKTEAERG